MAAEHVRKDAQQSKRGQARQSRSGESPTLSEPVAIVDAEVMPATEARLDQLGKPGELEKLLLHHAKDASNLARKVARFESVWVEFLTTADAPLVPSTLGLVTKIDRLRSGLVDETLRVAEIVHDLPKSRMNLTIRDSAVVVAPSSRRCGQAD
jgi:hypothetical protein